ncbi:MAG: hypothetical protein HY000_26815 [Planctomycetes bacterium]|nr:hypothetical protein [Planctomycetota bacterium]
MAVNRQRRLWHDVCDLGRSVIPTPATKGEETTMNEASDGAGESLSGIPKSFLQALALSGAIVGVVCVLLALMVEQMSQSWVLFVLTLPIFIGSGAIIAAIFAAVFTIGQE